jgi:outer membrane protein assembly factor BamB
MSMSYRQLLPLVALMVFAAGADWPQFRGPDSRGIAGGAAAPTQFGAKENVAWKVELPDRGLSSPIVIGGRVFVTASGGARRDRLHVLAFDAQTGKKLWQRNLWGTGPADAHPKSCMAAPTPAGDRTHILALFATNDLVCLDHDGNVLWMRALYDENSGATDGRGLASSPLLVDDTVVLHVENQNVSFAAGINLATGANRWRSDRPRELNWTSPIVIPGPTAGSKLALLQGMTRLSAVEPLTGKEVWRLDRTSDPIASSVVVDRTLLVPGDKGLAAFELQLGNAPPKQLWENLKLNPETASPLIVGDRVFALHGAFLVTGDLKTGKPLGSQLRLKGPFSSSPVVSGGLIYCFNESGVAQLVKPDDKEATLVQSCKLEETVLCTPAIVDGAIYVRSDKHLWKIAKG